MKDSRRRPGRHRRDHADCRERIRHVRATAGALAQRRQWSHTSHGSLARRARDTGAGLEFVVNGEARRVPDELGDPALPLLWALRDVWGLTGTKYGCGVGACGACTVHVDGQAVRACMTPLASMAGKRIVTIEALGSLERRHALQEAWIAQQV